MRYGVSFNPQVGATTGAKVGATGQSAGVELAASMGTALKGAQLRERRSQFERKMAQSQQQFDMRMGVEKQQFDRTMAMQKRGQDYEKKRAAKAERSAKIGTSIEIGKLGLGLANEYDIDLLGNIGFGADDTMDVSGSAQTAVEPSTMGGGDGSIDAVESGNQGGGWWESWGSEAATGVGGGAAGGMIGSNLASSFFGDGKTASTAGGAVGGGIGGYAATGTATGGIYGAVAGGILGYLFG